MEPIKIDKKALGEYSVAPYNFISLPETTVVRYKNIKDLPSHDSFKNDEGKKLLKGCIEYTLEAETPIIVSKGSDESENTKFFKNTSGEYAIPGNTIRGMIRTNSQILSYSNVADEIEDSRYLYRDIAGNNAASEQYKKVLDIKGRPSIARNLKVGYMRKVGKDYIIQPSMEIKMERPYFRIGEIKLRKVANNVNEINYMYSKNLIEKESEIKRLNKDGKRSEKNRLVDEEKNDNFTPYQIEISYNYDNKKNVTNIGKINEYKNKGYLLTAKHIYGKLAHYIIPEEDNNLPEIKIPNKSIEAYIDDMLITKKAKNKDGKIIVDSEYEFYGLPKNGEVKPVFYIKLGEDMHFGFTPNLRIMYGKSVLEGLPENYNSVDGISYTDSIFGFSNMGNDNISYKSRVSFQDAVVEGNGIIDSDSSIDILLAEPKPTSYNLYLEQKLNANKKDLDIYENNFKIRGIKQYWLKEYIEDPDVEVGKMTSKIYPLKEGTRFKGRIHFENLEEDELGLLLWSLKLEKNCYQNLGLAKPYGFGLVIIENINLELEDLDKKYNSFTFDYKEKKDEDKFINTYKKEFSEVYLNGKNIVEEKPIEELIKIKSKIIKREDANYYRYMEIERKEFGNKKVLPEILKYENVIKEKSKGYNKTKNYNKKTTPRKNTRNQRENTFGNKIDLSDWNKK